MQITKKTLSALSKLDSKNDGISSKEIIQKLDKNKDGQLDAKEAKVIGIDNPTDINIINNELKTHRSKPNAVLFPNIKNIGKINFGFDKANQVMSNVISKVPLVADRVRNLSEASGFPQAIARLSTSRIMSGSVFGPGELTPGRIRQIAANTINVKAGNCTELACVTAVEAKKAGAMKVELFSIENHLFVVTNRESNSNPGDPSTWGSKAIVLDTWAEETYTANEYFQHSAMKNMEPILESEYK